MGEKQPFWKRDKFWMVVVGIVGVLAVTLGGAAIGLDEDARAKSVDAVLWLVGLLMGGHTVTDVGSQVAKAMHHKAEVADPLRTRSVPKGDDSEGDDGDL